MHSPAQHMGHEQPVYTRTARRSCARKMCYFLRCAIFRSRLPRFVDIDGRATGVHREELALAVGRVDQLFLRHRQQEPPQFSLGMAVIA